LNGSRRSTYDDRMDSTDQMDRISVHSEGMSIGSGRTSPMPAATPDAQSRLSEFRDKHARAMEVLKKKTSNPGSRTPSEIGSVPPSQPPQAVQQAVPQAAPVDGASSGTPTRVEAAPAAAGTKSPIPPHSLSDPTIPTAPGQAAPAPRLSPTGLQSLNAAQPAAPSGAQALSDARERSAIGAAKVEERLSELQQESKGQLAELQVLLETQAKELASSLRSQQEASSQLSELRSLLEAQAREIDGLRSQELHIGVRAIKESLETYDKMGARRAQEVQISLSDLQDLVGAQGRELQELRAQEVGTGLGAVKEMLDMQSQALLQVGPQTQELRTALTVVSESVEAQAARINELRTQAREQHEERLEELRRLRAGMSLQQHEGLLGELDAHRTLQGQQEAAARSWQMERMQLQEEVARLSRGGAPGADISTGIHRQQTGPLPSEGSGVGPGSQRQASALAMVAAASAGLTALVLLLRPRGGSAPAQQATGGHPHGHLGHTLCAPVAALRVARELPRPLHLQLQGLQRARHAALAWQPLGSPGRRPRRRAL